jgi:ABC-type glycerol-3-phosphate transport system substrate-binding protein
MRRTPIVTLAIAAVFALAACGGSEATTTPSQPTTPTTTQPEVGLEIVPRDYEEFRAQPTA